MLTALLFAINQGPVVQVEALSYARDLFGVCIGATADLDGDGVNDLWIGDPSTPVNGDKSAGCVWAVSGKTGKKIRRIESPPGAQGFGWTLASTPNATGDHAQNLAVGCEVFSDPSSAEVKPKLGTIPPKSKSRVFGLSTAGALLFSVSGPSGRENSPWFMGAGPALVAAGDWNGDGVEDFAIGWALAGRENAINCGRVDVVSGKDGTTLQSWLGPDTQDRLGSSLAVLDDLDGDGKRELAAGAVPDYVSDGGPQQRKSNYVQVLSSKGGVLHTLVPSDGSREFGTSLAAFPDADHDGVPDLIIGQPSAYDLPTAITIWSMKAGKLLRRIEPPDLDKWESGGERRGVSRSSSTVIEWFGTQLIAVPDRDGDGCSDILVTVPQADCSVPAGVLSSANGRPLAHVELVDERNSARLLDFSHIGMAVCRIGDVDGDGVQDFAIGGASVGCGQCQGSVVIVSGKSLRPIRVIVRQDMDH